MMLKNDGDGEVAEVLRRDGVPVIDASPTECVLYAMCNQWTTDVVSRERD